MAICVLVLVTLSLMTSEINRIDGERSRRAVSAALESFAVLLGNQVADQATWTEAYLNTYISHNPAWLDSAWGSTARADGHYDAAILTDSSGTILFGESAFGPLTGSILDHFSGADSVLRALNASVAEGGTNTRIARFAKTGHGIAAVAAGIIQGSARQVAVAPERRRILWFSKHIDGDMLAAIGTRFQVPVPRLEPGTSAAGEETLTLTDAAGTTIGTLSWHALRPGDAAFVSATSVASIVLLVVGILVFLVLAAFRRSIEKRAESEERGWIDARYDAATGLVNRFGLEEAIAKLPTAKDGSLNLAVAVIEFEGLKNVEGFYGQDTTEALLARLATLIDEVVEGSADLARIGSDQFALSKIGAGAGDALHNIAQRVMKLVAEAIPLDNLRLKLSASIGVAEAAITRENIGSVFSMAATALQRARETGGNDLVVYDLSLEDNRQRHLAMQSDIRRGLDADEFDLEYQPIIDFNRQRVLGVEALLRWSRRQGGAMSPGEFIPAAEASGLIEELGLFALQRACREIAAFDELKLSVNVSTVQFRSPALVARLNAILGSTGFPPSRLQLEITESFLLAQPERAKAAIEQLRSLGISIALDDFGTGFSSVGYLRQFSFDCVKLDRSLVEEIDVQPVKLALVESTMIFAFAMGLSVTAEGVERREEAATLTRLGCNQFQGYLFSRPLKLEALGRLLGKSPALKKAS